MQPAIPLVAPPSVLKPLWSFFRSEARWPSRKEFLLIAEEERLSIEPDGYYSNLAIGRGAQDQVRPSFLAIITLPEVRDLLSPLPALLRQAAAGFVTKAPGCSDNTLPTLHFREVRSLWATGADARTAIDVLRSTDSGLLTGGGSNGSDRDDFWFSLSIDVLRYENVCDLDDVLRVGHFAKVDVGRFPSGTHLDVLRRIYSFSKSELRWPPALQFALANRTIGFVPDLARDLTPRFIRGDFQTTNHHALVLTAHAFPFVASSDERTLFVNAVRSIVRLWRRSSEPANIPLGDVAADLSVPLPSLAPVAAFLDWSTWCHAGHVHGDSHTNLVFVPGDPALVLRNKKLRTFDEYMDLWFRDAEHDAPRPAGAFAEAVPSPVEPDMPPALQVPDIPLTFLSQRYLPTLRSDLEELARTIVARSWKASLILIGGIIECVLLDVLSRREDVAASVLRKPLSKASLMDLIEGAVALQLLAPSVKPFVDVAKDYRDLTHPFRAAASPLRPRCDAVKAMLHALELATAELEAARLDGRLSRFELQ